MKNAPRNLVRELIQKYEAGLTASHSTNETEEAETSLPKNSNTSFPDTPLHRLKTSILEPPGAAPPGQMIPEERRLSLPEQPLLQGNANRDTLKVPESTVASESLKVATLKQREGCESSIVKMKGPCPDGVEECADPFHKDLKEEAAGHRQAKESNKMIVALPEDLIVFIKSSDVLSRYNADFKKRKHPVSFELSSNLVLSSRSQIALREALSAVQRDFSVETIKLRGATAVPPELDRVKETLMNGNNEDNPVGLRANIQFFPGLEGNKVTKVRLVGFSHVVSKLQEILQDHLENLITTQDTVILPNPQLVDHFEKFMGLIGMMETQVTFEASHLPGPCVRLSGPTSKVHEAKEALSSALARVISDSLVVDGPGAHRYFQADGRVSKELIESSCKVVVTATKRTGVLRPKTGSPSQCTRTVTTALTKHELMVDILLRRVRNMNGLFNWSPNQRTPAAPGSDPPDLEEVTVNLQHGVTLQLVFGDITKETPDVVVNSTNFKDFHGGVCNAILSVAGPHLETLLKKAKVKRGAVFVTPPGWFPCKSIFHVHGQKNAQIIEQLVSGIIQQCESLQYKSVAIPAICAGAARLDPQVVADSILKAIKGATSSTPLRHLSNIRLVLSEVKLFFIFKQQLERTFPGRVMKAEEKQTVDLIPRLLSTCSREEQSIFSFMGLCREDVDDAKTKISDLYEAHCSTQTFPKEDLQDLTEANVTVLQQLLQAEALHVEEDTAGNGGLKVIGLKVGVNKVAQMLHTIAPLQRKMTTSEEENLYARVTWCILDTDGKWERLPKAAGHNLEKRNVAKGIRDSQERCWSVDLQRMEANSEGRRTKLKRLENRADFTFPLDWDNMKPEDNLEVFLLQEDSAEFQAVKNFFTRTATQTVSKIERLQNVHLRCTYEMQKLHISEKNKPHGAGEKLLFHGTSRDSCDSIMKNGFNRSYSGTNGASIGHGTYFAVDASYSVRYTKPGADGSRTMFLARVLTGSCTQGQGHMRFPPPRSSQQPHDCYDSVVDRLKNPNMYAVFNDNQAYPEYLITFY